MGAFQSRRESKSQFVPSHFQSTRPAVRQEQISSQAEVRSKRHTEAAAVRLEAVSFQIRNVRTQICNLRTQICNVRTVNFQNARLTAVSSALPVLARVYALPSDARQPRSQSKSY